MTPTLRASTLATAAATILAFGAPNGAFADGRGDWNGYAWQKIEIAKCATAGDTISFLTPDELRELSDEVNALAEKWDRPRDPARPDAQPVRFIYASFRQP